MLYNTVLDRRQLIGITQEELAALAGISSRTIMLLESGQAPDIKLSTMMKICKALVVPDYRDLFTYVIEGACKDGNKR